MIETRRVRREFAHDVEVIEPPAGDRSSLYRVQCYKFAHLTSLMSLINGSAASNREQEALDTFLDHWNDETLDGDALVRILELTLDLCLEYLREAALVASAVPITRPNAPVRRDKK